MPLKVSVGLTKKLGLPNYGSAGASCSMEFELDSGQILHDPDGFQRNIRNAYVACRQAIQDELRREVPSTLPPEPPGESTPSPTVCDAVSDTSTRATSTPATLGLTQTSPIASQRQVNYLHHLAHGISGMTPRRLEILSATICGKRIVHLTTADASRLIDTLKEIQSGARDLSGFPEEDAA